MNEQRIGDLERYLEQNKQIKGKWCATVDEITEKFQAEFDQLMESTEGK